MGSFLKQAQQQLLFFPKPMTYVTIYNVLRLFTKGHHNSNIFSKYTNYSHWNKNMDKVLNSVRSHVTHLKNADISSGEIRISASFFSQNRKETIKPYCKSIEQENPWKRRMLPKWLLSIKGRTCNPTPLVHQDITKKTTFYEKGDN